jgi:hypothetical protein
MPMYHYQGDMATYHPGLGMLLVPGMNDIPMDKAELADTLPYLTEQASFDFASDEDADDIAAAEAALAEADADEEEEPEA